MSKLDNKNYLVYIAGGFVLVSDAGVELNIDANLMVIDHIFCQFKIRHLGARKLPEALFVRQKKYDILDITLQK